MTQKEITPQEIEDARRLQTCLYEILQKLWIAQSTMNGTGKAIHPDELRFLLPRPHRHSPTPFLRPHLKALTPHLEGIGEIVEKIEKDINQRLSNQAHTPCLEAPNHTPPKNTDLPDQHKKLLAVIRESGPKGITLSRLTHKSRWVKSAERRAMLEALQDGGLIRLEIDQKIRPGRPKIRARPLM